MDKTILCKFAHPCAETGLLSLPLKSCVMTGGIFLCLALVYRGKLEMYERQSSIYGEGSLFALTQDELKSQIKQIMEQHKIGTLATVKNDKPHTRYMTFWNDEQFTFYTPTNSDTHKADEIEANPNVHILIGYEGEGYGDTYLEVEGQAKIREDQEIKEELWSERMNRWFDGKDDPNYIVLEIMPESIRLMNEGEDTPATLDL